MAQPEARRCCCGFNVLLAVSVSARWLQVDLLILFGSFNRKGEQPAIAQHLPGLMTDGVQIASVDQNIGRGNQIDRLCLSQCALNIAAFKLIVDTLLCSQFQHVLRQIAAVQSVDR